MTALEFLKQSFGPSQLDALSNLTPDEWQQLQREIPVEKQALLMAGYARARAKG